MVLKKRNLASIFENNNNELEETLQVSQPQTPRQMQVPQPPVASRQAASEADWGDLLIRLLASAPEDVAQKLISCIDREVIAKVFEKRNDPYLKAALLLLKK